MRSVHLRFSDNTYGLIRQGVRTALEVSVAPFSRMAVRASCFAFLTRSSAYPLLPPRPSTIWRARCGSWARSLKRFSMQADFDTTNRIRRLGLSRRRILLPRGFVDPSCRRHFS